MNQMFSSLKEKWGNTYDIQVLSESPWIVTFDNFLNDKEIKAIIATQKKWERSTDTGTSNEYGETGRVLSQGRTSSNSWCDKDCENHPDVKSVTKKIEAVTGVPSVNYESFQVLRYELGQKYVAHHDYGHDEVHLACGPRILTFFLYLSDVEEGGETGFPTLNIAVKPKKGRALLWPSTLSDDPERQDGRTTHEARPVIKGRKFAANAWIHLYDFMTPNHWGCTGTFDEL
jgi:prolyl 4-hydroxylase